MKKNVTQKASPQPLALRVRKVAVRDLTDGTGQKQAWDQMCSNPMVTFTCPAWPHTG